MNDALHYLLYNLAKALSPFMQQDSYLYWPYILSSIAIALFAWGWLGAAGAKSRPWRDFCRQ